MSFEEAAGATEGARHALGYLRAARVGPGHSVLVHGASVTAVCATPELERVLARAPGAVIDRLAEDFTRCGEKFDLALDAVGNQLRRLPPVC
ncbi:MAG: hypothetical protein L0H93_09450 [Nocardioides sp.]|nr:hypothetical protein [Nocardioides sp.]